MKSKIFIFGICLISILTTLISGCNLNDITTQTNLTFIFSNEKSNSQSNGESQEGTMPKSANYYFPNEEEEHEGTWLTWPHSFTYGKIYRDEIEPIWIKMVQELQVGENIHIIAYNSSEQERIEDIFVDNNISFDNIDFVIAPSNDVWVRDTGPMFVFGENGEMVIADFGFDGWGKKTKYDKDDVIPKIVAREKIFDIIDIGEFILEGGSIELDGKGTLMATLSSVFSKNRNSNLNIKVVENYLKKYFSVSNIIWLDGVIDEDITDAHIDGIARFAPDNKLLTVSESDFYELYEGILESDYAKLKNARNSSGQKYNIITLPLTSRNVQGLDYKGSYLNYYIGNDIVLMPAYNDPNDIKAANIIKTIFPERKVVLIDVTKLYKNGGMIHCITQQQPKYNK